jgi:hypothetical protein
LREVPDTAGGGDDEAVQSLKESILPESSEDKVPEPLFVKFVHRDCSEWRLTISFDFFCHSIDITMNSFLLKKYLHCSVYPIAP